MKGCLHIALLITVSSFSCCCSMRPDKPADPAGRIYTVYVMNRNIHTGLIIPVNEIAKATVSATKYFENAVFMDFGWGEEAVYQARDETFCMDLKAVLMPSSSVMCVEALNLDIKLLAGWSDYALEFRLTETEFRDICLFIDGSFTRDSDNRLIATSVRSGGSVIYFKSVHTYCLFNTCNTWIAEALSNVVPGISPFMVITKYGLYDEIAEKGIVLKRRNGRRSFF